MLSESEFAQKIKTKFPQYAKVPDAILVQKIIDKHPEYKDQVQQSFVSKAIGATAGISPEIASKGAALAQATQAKPAEPKKDLGAFEKNTEALTPLGLTKGILKGGAAAVSEMASLGEKGLQAITGVNKGQETGGEQAAGAEILKPTSTTEGIVKNISQVLLPMLATGGITSGLAKTGASLGAEGLTALGASEKTASALAPIAGGLAASPFTTTMATSSLEGRLPSRTELAVGVALDSVLPAYSAIKELRSPTLTEAIETGITKGVKPSVSGKQTAGDYQAYLDKAENAVKTVVANKNDLKLVDEFGEALPAGSVPQNLQQFSDAIDQTKTKIFTAYDDLAKQAGNTGLIVNTSSVADELQKIIDNKAIQTAAPDMAEYAKQQLAIYGGEGVDLTPQEAQDAIKILNERLKAFYQNPTAKDFGAAKVDALIANNLRNNLDSSIEEITGGGQYQELKDAYGSLKTIEKDVLNRAIIDARKNNKGLIDFSDIFSAGDVLSGVLTGSPGQIAKGVVQKGISSWYKSLNSPNKIIQTMFSEADKLMPTSQITGAGIEQMTQEVAKALPDTLTKEDAAQIITQLLKGLIASLNPNTPK